MTRTRIETRVTQEEIEPGTTYINGCMHNGKYGVHVLEISERKPIKVWQAPDNPRKTTRMGYEIKCEIEYLDLSYEDSDEGVGDVIISDNERFIGVVREVQKYVKIIDWEIA